MGNKEAVGEREDTVCLRERQKVWGERKGRNKVFSEARIALFSVEQEVSQREKLGEIQTK